MDRVIIEAAENGYIMKYDDPAIIKKNRESDGWTDPEVRRVYPDESSMVQDLATVLPELKTKAAPAEDYAEAFEEATRE